MSEEISMWHWVEDGISGPLRNGLQMAAGDDLELEANCTWGGRCRMREAVPLEIGWLL